MEGTLWPLLVGELVQGGPSQPHLHLHPRVLAESLTRLWLSLSASLTPTRSRLGSPVQIQGYCQAVGTVNLPHSFIHALTSADSVEEKQTRQIPAGSRSLAVSSLLFPRPLWEPQARSREPPSRMGVSAPSLDSQLLSQAELRPKLCGPDIRETKGNPAISIPGFWERSCFCLTFLSSPRLQGFWAWWGQAIYSKH